MIPILFYITENALNVFFIMNLSIGHNLSSYFSQDSNIALKR